MPKTAPPLEIPPRDKRRLRSWTQSRNIPAGLAQRARIVLLAGHGYANADIAERTGVSRPTVILWRNRYAAGGLGALEDEPGSGRPKRIDPLAVVIATLEPPPERLGVTHWSSRLLAKEPGISNATVATVWQDYELQPWRRETFKFSTDPQLEAKVRDIVGLYLNPPEGAVVVCVDEKSRIQALNRTAPILPLRPGLPEKATCDYVRNGTTTLLAALEAGTGKVTDACCQRHRHTGFLRFLKHVAKEYPRRDLHVVCDNYATRKHPAVKAWLARNPRVTLHFTPTSGSWLNMVEIFFGIITRQAIRRGSFDSVRELTAAIRQFIDGWNDRCEPFAWTKPADQILAHAIRKETS